MALHGMVVPLLYFPANSKIAFSIFTCKRTNCFQHLTCLFHVLRPKTHTVVSILAGALLALFRLACNQAHLSLSSHELSFRLRRWHAITQIAAGFTRGVHQRGFAPFSCASMQIHTDRLRRRQWLCVRQKGQYLLCLFENTQTPNRIIIIQTNVPVSATKKGK